MNWFTVFRLFFFLCVSLVICVIQNEQTNRSREAIKRERDYIVFTKHVFVHMGV